MINIGNGIYIDKSQVQSVEDIHRYYMNGSDYRILIKMRDGTEYRVNHGFGVNIFNIKAELIK